MDAEGRRGVVFRSLEAARLMPVLVARASRPLPYLWARMAGPPRPATPWPTSLAALAGTARRGRPRAVRIGERVAGRELALFLTARWGLHLVGGRAAYAYAPVDHAPWPLHRAELLELADDLVERPACRPPATPLTGGLLASPRACAAQPARRSPPNGRAALPARPPPALQVGQAVGSPHDLTISRGCR